MSTSSISIAKLSRYFIYATMINLLVAIGITTPVLVPEFTFPIYLTAWPGTWMFISYFSFLIVAVLGSLGWAVLLNFVESKFQRHSTNRYLAEAHITLSYLGLYGMTSLMFRLGYLGGAATFDNIGRGIITQGLIGWMVVPIGTFLYLFIIGTVIGIANIILTISRPDSAA